LQTDAPVLAGADVRTPPRFVGTSADTMNAVETATAVEGGLDRVGAGVLSDAFADYP
jgi:hypothetical protein